MNSAQFYIKKNGDFVKLDGNAVFPFRWGELLDERLDEAYLNTRRSTTENYTPTTIIRADISDGTNTRQEYFALARDGSIRFPNWSETYKHDMYLLELTKLWEGILCPSMTFTNSLGANYSKIARRVYGTVEYGFNNSMPFEIGAIVSPVSENDNVVAPDVDVVGNAAADSLNAGSAGYYIYYASNPDHTQYSTYDIVIDGTTIVHNRTDAYEITPAVLEGHKSLKYEYTLWFYANGGYGIQNATVEISIVKDQNPIKPWTVTDCVTRIFERAEPLRKGQAPRYRLDGVEYGANGEVMWYDQQANIKYRPGSEAEKYDEIYIPDNLSMTQCTLREALKVVGSLIHAEPWLDHNNVAHFKPYGSTEASGLANKTPVYDSYSYDINQYATEVRSNAKNLVSTLRYAEGAIYDPSRYLYKSVRPNVTYARVEEKNGVAKADRTIYTVEEVRCGLINTSEDGWAIEPCDITPYVFEATEYHANLSSFEGGYPYSKSYAIYYTTGGNTLEGLFYQVPDAVSSAYENFAITNILTACNTNGLSDSDVDDLVTHNPENLVFQISYKPLSSQMVAHGKQEYNPDATPFVQISNQSENLIESDWYGENLKGVSARLGNVERERTYIVYSLDDIPEVGQMLDGYAISAVSVEMLPYFFKVGVGLTKDFNRISEYVGISSAKRFYEVSERDTYECDILMSEKLIIGPAPSGYSNSGKLFRDISGVRSIFVPDAQDDPYRPVSLARMRTRLPNGDKMWDNFFPVIPRALGNAITFTFTAKDNFSAGETLVYKTGGDDIKGWWSADAQYTDFYGRAYWAQLDLYPAVVDVPPSQKVDFARKFPIATNDMIEELPGAVITTDTAYHKLRKDNREIISYTLELEIKTTIPGLNVGSGLAKLCPMVSYHDGAVKPHLYYSKVPINKFDATINTRDTASYVDAGEIITSSLSGGVFSLTGSTTAPPIDNTQYYGWIIAMPSTIENETFADENGINATIPKYNGGDVIMSRNIEFKRTATYSPSYLLQGVDFYVE